MYKIERYKEHLDKFYLVDKFYELVKKGKKGYCNNK